MKILRVNFEGVNCYTVDETGKAEVYLWRWLAYLDALDCIQKFEEEVDRQYDANE